MTLLHISGSERAERTNAAPTVRTTRTRPTVSTSLHLRGTGVQSRADTRKPVASGVSTSCCKSRGFRSGRPAVFPMIFAGHQSEEPWRFIRQVLLIAS